MDATNDATTYKQRKKAWNKGRRRAIRPFKGLAVFLPFVAIIAALVLYVFDWFPMTFDLVMGATRYEIVNPDDSAQYFTSDFATDDERVEYGRQLSETVEAEGATLLRNTNDALPLEAGSKVTLFSHSSVDPVYGGTGSAGLDVSQVKSFEQAFEDVGIEVNPTMWDFYSEGAGSEYKRQAAGMVADENSVYAANEVPLDVYTDAEWASVEEYSDAAVMVVSRVGGEGADLPSATDDAESGGYLGLDHNERALLEHLTELREAGTIKKIVVLLNSSNAIQLDFLFDERYDVDAALWVGGMGGEGINAVANILAGAVNPSGRLADTFLVDNLSAPAMANFGSWDYTNAEEAGLTKYNGNYVVYQEGIYVGYRYYETRYEDFVMGAAGAGSYDYAGDVAFPFGYGLSYSTFAYSDFGVAYDAAADTYTVSVTVTNTGDVAGKHTVQVYAQSPYTDYDRANGIEKPAATLAGFNKTKLLEPGASQALTVEVDGADLASYDANGAGTYIMDAGTHRLTVAADAHAAVNNFLADKGFSPESTAGRMDGAGNAGMVWRWEVDALDTTTYATSASTGAAIENQFDDADLNRSDFTGDQGVTYVSRSDWESTLPATNVELTATDEMVKELAYSRYANGEYDGEFAGASMPTLNADNGLKAFDLIGVAYDDPAWDDLLDQMSAHDMAYLLGSAFHYTQPIESIELPGTRDENGPTGLTTTLFGMKSDVKTMGLPSEDVMGATFNTELMQDVGRVIGNDCIAAKVSFLYGPGANIHRTPYSGRNFEYFSEDGLLSGKLLAAEVTGIESKGAGVMIKHFALNDQELDRAGICTWSNEQAIREVYLKAFEDAFTEAGANGVMSAYNRVGCHWSGADEGMIGGILRGEWGCEGAVITDNSALDNTWMDGADAVLAGADLFDSMTEIEYEQLLEHTDDPVVMAAMREASHRTIYSIVNSLGMNGVGADSTIKAVTPGYVMIARVILGVAAAGFVASTALVVVRGRKYRAAHPKPKRED